ncbi:hypothetical protein B0H10DRAFT_2223379 [Mycena sp. CBHHK59/15]|nr:hypothetical protein B0H10DRAFT_2223379 [Mycena sp. CBHHK59/15]
MAAAPPRVHRVAKDVFTIPQEFHFELLPSAMISVTKMLEFAVPLQSIANDVAQPAHACVVFPFRSPRSFGSGGLARAGDAEKSDAEGEEAAPVIFGRGQRKKIGTTRYQGALWEEH